MLVVFGAINIDMVFPVAVLPKAGDTIRSAPGWNHSGGKAGNQAVAAARDGADVHLVGAVGNDPLADLVLADLAKEGLHLRNVVQRPGITGRAVVCVTADGKSMVVADVGANREALAAQVSDTLLGPRTTLLVQLDVESNETVALIVRARRKNTRIILNLSPARVIDTEALRIVDLLVGNTEELAWLGEHLGTGNNPASLRAALGIDTVRMMGVQGAEAAWREGFVSVAADPVDARDTTVAGDCFIGVLAATLDKGVSLPNSLRRAAVAAALSTTRFGSGSSLPRATEITAALRTAPQITTTEPQISD